MFANPLFKDLGVKQARFITAWDTANVKFERDLTDTWMSAARKAGVQPLVSFYHSRVNPRRNPSVSAYTKAFKAFKKRYPFVKVYSPWNEANHKGGSRFANPSAKLAAKYYEAVRKNCKGCKIVGLDVLDSTNVNASVKYVKDFKKAVKVQPKIWGLHNYSDTNRFRNKGTKAILKATGKGELWLTETGGIVRFGRNFPKSEARAAKAVKFMFTLAKSNKRIKRLYIFNWMGETRPSAPFDAGLIDGLTGKPRPAYTVVKTQLRR
jgi:hypothetical protein